MISIKKGKKEIAHIEEQLRSKYSQVIDLRKKQSDLKKDGIVLPERFANGEVKEDPNS